MGRGESMVIHKRMSFLASLVWGICSVIMVTVICSSGIIFYGLHIVDIKSDGLQDLIGHSLEGLPAVVKSVPILADALSDERRLDYVDDLDIEMSFTEHPCRQDRMQAVVTVANRGQELVSMLSVRVVVTDDRGNIVAEDVEFVATPFPLDQDLPGPLMPGSTRRVTTGSFKKIENPTAEYEISEIRVWVRELENHGATSASTRDFSSPGVRSSVSAN